MRRVRGRSNITFDILTKKVSWHRYWTVVFGSVLFDTVRFFKDFCVITPTECNILPIHKIKLNTSRPAAGCGGSEVIDEISYSLSYHQYRRYHHLHRLLLQSLCYPIHKSLTFEWTARLKWKLLTMKIYVTYQVAVYICSHSSVC